MLFDKIIKGKRAFKRKVKPKGYGNLNKPVPDEIPKPNVGCGIHTDKCQGLLFSWIVSQEEAMDYDDVEGTITSTRELLTEDTGLVECRNGVTRKGHKYIYNIQKMRYSGEGMPVLEVSYNLNFNVNIDGVNYFINGNYVEVGITGLRDSLGFSLFQKSVEEKHPGENYSVKDIMKMFFRDPDECF